MGGLTTIRDIQPSTSPPFTGFLDLRPGKGMEYFTHKLLSAPGEAHFRGLAMTRDHEEDIPLAITLIKRVVPPLTLEITPRLFGMSALHFHLHSPVNWFVDSYQRSEVSLREARSSKWRAAGGPSAKPSAHCECTGTLWRSPVAQSTDTWPQFPSSPVVQFCLVRWVSGVLEGLGSCGIWVYAQRGTFTAKTLKTLSGIQRGD